MHLEGSPVVDCDCALTVTPGKNIRDWYVIERAEHDGRSWIEWDGESSGSLMLSSRIGNADIEGTHAEMTELAKGIREKRSVIFKRCAVEPDAKGNILWSPRNSLYWTRVPSERALALADLILALPPPTPETKEEWESRHVAGAKREET
jgi:hypothetical protein